MIHQSTQLTSSPAMRLGLTPIALIAAFALLSGCAHRTPTAKLEPEKASTHSMQPGSASTDNLNAVLYFQRAAEYRAAAKQAFIQAQQALLRIKDQRETAIPDEQSADFETLPPAVVVDVDETMLDNSIYMARLVHNGQSFAEPTWNAFCREDISTSIPGAREFTQFAKANGVKVIYISNRTADLTEVTRATLNRLGFADAENTDSFAFRDPAKGWDTKGARRAHFAKRYRIVMLVGDNLGDFTEAYRGTEAERAALVDASPRWGGSWIMLPNPMYGSWERPYQAPSIDESRKLRLNGLIK